MTDQIVSPCDTRRIPENALIILVLSRLNDDLFATMRVGRRRRRRYTLNL